MANATIAATAAASNKEEPRDNVQALLIYAVAATVFTVSLPQAGGRRRGRCRADDDVIDQRGNVVHKAVWQQDVETLAI